MPTRWSGAWALVKAALPVNLVAGAFGVGRAVVSAHPPPRRGRLGSWWPVGLARVCKHIGRWFPLVIVAAVLLLVVVVAIADHNNPNRLSVQVFRGGCTRVSRVVSGPVQTDLSGTLGRFRCTQAEMRSRALHPDHLTVTFWTKNATNDLSVTFAGVIAPDRRSMSVEQVSFLSNGNNYSVKTPVEASCRFTYRGKSVAFMFCKARIDEGGWQTLVDIVFDAGW